MQYRSMGQGYLAVPKLRCAMQVAFLELHIEQGGILENENIQIGIVEGIVGIRDCVITIEGFANHAGTTPMKLRKDALLAASKLVVAVGANVLLQTVLSVDKG